MNAHLTAVPQKTQSVNLGLLSSVNLRVLVVALLFSILVVWAGQSHAAAPANSVIGNQASATYVDATATQRTSTSNTVQTTVSQVFAFTLTVNGTRTLPANAPVCYPHTITNNGNGADTYVLNAPTTGGMFAHTGLVYYLANGGNPANGTPITTSGAVAAGATFNFVVCGTTAATATPGQQGTISVTVSDRNGGAGTVTSPAQVNTTTIGNAAVSVQKRLSSVEPPGFTAVTGGPSPNNSTSLYVVLDYTNSGTFAANNLVLTDNLPTGWVYAANSGRWSVSGMTALSDAAGGDPAGIDYAGTATSVIATVSSVPGSTSGTVYFRITIAPNLLPSSPPSVLTNTANYAYTDSVTMTTTTSTTNAVRYDVTPIVALAINGSATTTGLTDAEPVTVASASPGATVQWTDYVWHNGNGTITGSTDTYNVRFLDGAALPVGSSTFNGANCSPTPSTVVPNQCTFPAGTTFQLFAANGMTTLLDSDGDGVPDTGPIPVPVGGVCPAPYIVSTSTPLRCGYPVIVRATLPTGTTGNNMGNGYRIVLTATSRNNATVNDTVENRLTTIAASTVDLTNNSAIPAANAGNSLPTGTPCVGVYTPGTGFNTGGVSTGSTVISSNCVVPTVGSSTVTRFPLFVNNTSTIPAIYNLNTPTFSSVPAGLNATPTGWSVSYRDSANGTDCSATVGGPITSTGATPIAAGASRLVCAEVSVPSSNSPSGAASPTAAPPGNYNIVFGATNQADGSVVDTITDQVVVRPSNSVSITPNGMQNVVPGGAVTYVHTLANNGNVAETITFPGMCLTNSQVPTYTWTSSAYLDATPFDGTLNTTTDTLITCGTTTVTLQPNETRTLFVRVNAPPMAGSPPNTTTISAAYNGGMSTASANDISTLTGGTLALDKYQQLIPSCMGGTPAVTVDSFGVPTGAWTSAPVPASANTAPGRCIAYLVIGSNRTGANITNISITDVVPANSYLVTGCGAPSAVGPLAIVGTYANGFTGTVTAQSSPTPTTPLPPVNIGAGGALPLPGVVALQFCVRINDL
jgi:trimeric autotransporter adhesin